VARGRSTGPCPHCGAEVPAGARACPECGSDETTGWSDEADAWAGDLPTGYGDEDELDYEEVLRREGLLQDRPPREVRERALGRWIVAALVLAILAWLVAR